MKPDTYQKKKHPSQRSRSPRPQVQQLTYEDNIADLWHELDADGSKMLTLDESRASESRVVY